MKKTASFDIAKFICAFLVIMIHTFPLSGIWENGNTILVSYVARIAVPLFFVISSYFFFQHQDENHIKTFMKRLGKIYIIWSLIYLPFFIWYQKDYLSFITIIKWFFNFFINGSYYHLWFIPALIFAMYIVNLLRKHFNLKQMITISLVLYFIGYLGNIHMEYLLDHPLLSIVWDPYIEIFNTTRNGLFFGIPFVTMGYLCASQPYQNHPKDTRFFLLSSICIYVIELWLYQEMDILEDRSCMYLTLIPLVYYVFRWLESKEIEIKPKHIMLRKMSLLIYVSHIAIYIVLGKIFAMTRIDIASNLEMYFYTSILSLLLSGGIVYLSKYIPQLKHLY